jgi:hypothetical protein
MHKKMTPQQIDMLISTGAVRDEFAQKIKELNRRLKLNGMEYGQWETLNDRQHDIFTDNLFLNGDCASSPDNYVKGAVESCGCPDVVDDLHYHSPALMNAIEHQQELAPAMTVKIGESLGFLNEFIDKEVGLIQEASPAVQEYEQRVLDSLEIAGIQGSMEVADADSNGPDGQFVIDGQPFWLEIKLNTRAQMGDGAIKYFPARPKGERFFLAKPEKFDEQGWSVAKAALQTKEDDILTWVEALRDPARPASEKWVDNPEATALGFQTTARRYQAAKEAGLLNKASAGFGKLPTIKAPPSFINKMYGAKDIFYIQVGGKGLYYMADNPANLPIPQFTGEINVEMRPRASGRPKTKDAEGNKIYKYVPSAVDGDENVLYQGGTYSVVARFISKDLEPSPYTLDDPESIRSMLAQVEPRDPAEPEGLEVEPEESEGL